MNVADAAFVDIIMHMLQSIFCLLSLASALQAVFARPEIRYTRTSTIAQSFDVSEVNVTFDYVVVSDGTAKLTIVFRLTVKFSISVAVVEAENFYEIDDDNINVIFDYCIVYVETDSADANPLMNWKFITVPQVISALMNIIHNNGLSF